MRSFLPVFVLSVALAAPHSADAGLLFQSVLLGENERPVPVETDALGSAVMVVNPDTFQFDLTMFVVGITIDDLVESEAGRFHIHIGGPEEAGGVIFQFAGLDDFWETTLDGVLLKREIKGAQFGQEFMDDYWDDLLAGNTYLNLHTQAYPAGEIRGQLVLIPEPASLMIVGVGGLLLLRRPRRPVA